MELLRLVGLIVVALGLAHAQVGPCYPPFTSPVVPALHTYISSLQSSISAMRSEIVGLPQPAIQLDGQAVFAVQGKLESGSPGCNPYYPSLGSPPSMPCTFDNYLVQRGYLQALRNAGVQGVDITISVNALKNAPEYVYAWTQLVAQSSGTGGLFVGNFGGTYVGFYGLSGATGTLHNTDPPLTVTQGSYAVGQLGVYGCGTPCPIGQINSHVYVTTPGSGYSPNAAVSITGAHGSISASNLLIQPPITATCGSSNNVNNYLSLPYPYALGPAWQASHNYQLGNTIFDPPSGHLQLVTIAGQSGGTVPTWNIGGNTHDGSGTLQWTDQGAGNVDAVPGGTFYCADLAVQDDLIAFANSLTATNGQAMKLRLAPSPGAENNMTSGCLLVGGGTPATNLGLLENCYDPLYYAAVMRWNGQSQGYGHTGPGWIESFTPLHEPAGAWGTSFPANYLICGSGYTTCAANTRAFIQSTYSAIRSAETGSSTSTPPVGAGITCPTGPPPPGSQCLSIGASAGTDTGNSQEAGFWSDWVANVAAGAMSLDYFSLDLYANTWDASVYAAQGQWICQAVTTYCTNVLIPCSPSAQDYNNDCQWMVSATPASQSGAALASVVPMTGGTSGISGGPGTCVATFNGAVGGAKATATVNSSGAVTALTMTNAGSNFSQIPNSVPLASCTGSTTGTGSVTIASGLLANYATGGALSFATNLANQAKGIGRNVRLNEANRPVYVLTGCAPEGSKGIYDNDYIEWQNDGMDVAWFDAIVPWASANGFTSISAWATQMFNWYNSTDVNPQCVQTGSPPCPDTFAPQIPFFAQPGYLFAGSTPLGVSNPGLSQAGLAWLQLEGGSAASLQGKASLTGGKFQLGH